MDPNEQAPLDDFYLRYYTGHTGQFGHEFLEFAIMRDGLLRYANASHYKKDGNIMREVYLNECVVDEFKRIVQDSDILQQKDELWPEPDKGGKQTIEILYKNVHIAFETNTISSTLAIKDSKDPEGLQAFYYLVQDLKGFVFSLIQLHFKVNPI
ncbi:putative Protein mago nashi like protein [Blattamonas nauphoetae]|uniref:Protein mago nashi n=1 Tax=Blattamonas nauphoetae TaxID=2049346 RepID=A0ABQ9YI54_9EUKA|nr:putative Protein mago nashi like protein [Blattamonas nauphoetae]